MELRVGSIGGCLKAPPGSSAFLVKNLCLSCDPYMRGCVCNSHYSYISPFVSSQPIEGFGVSKVVNSNDPDFKPGDLVSELIGWEEYSLIRKIDQLRKIEQHDVPPVISPGPPRYVSPTMLAYFMKHLSDKMV